MVALKAAFTEPWLQAAGLADTDADADADADASLEECRAMINLHQIDMGEASALVLAQQLATQGTAALLLIDEHRGRQAAQHCKVAVICTAGLLVLAKHAGARRRSDAGGRLAAVRRMRPGQRCACAVGRVGAGLDLLSHPL